jgi:uncharacterized membrane protein YkgB
MKTASTSLLLCRLALFVIYFWFGILKVLGLSPASGIVQELYQVTLQPMMAMAQLPAVSAQDFVVVFGVLEVIIGTLFLIPRFDKLTLPAFAAHMLTTTLPLFFLKASAWTGFLVPTLEGQYIIKNLALMACAVNIWVATHKARA